MPTRRQERINQRLVVEISDIIRTLKDPRIGFVTVTGASVSPDLQNARIRVSVLGEADVTAKTLAGLQHSAGHIRALLGRRLAFKVTPQLEFVYDRTIQYADDIARLIAQARASDPNPGPATPEEAKADPDATAVLGAPDDDMDEAFAEEEEEGEEGDADEA